MRKKRMKRWAKLNAAAWGMIVLAMGEHLPSMITKPWQLLLALGVEVIILWLIWKSIDFACGQ